MSRKKRENTYEYHIPPKVYDALDKVLKAIPDDERNFGVEQLLRKHTSMNACRGARKLRPTLYPDDMN